MEFLERIENAFFQKGIFINFNALHSFYGTSTNTEVGNDTESKSHYRLGLFPKFYLKGLKMVW